MALQSHDIVLNILCIVSSNLIGHMLQLTLQLLSSCNSPQSMGQSTE